MSGIASSASATVILFLFLLACGPLPSGDPVAGAGQDEAKELDHSVIIGANDLVPVATDAMNVPERYRHVVDAFGRISLMGCTATHVGDGVVLTAGHCFQASAEREGGLACDGVTIEWGVRDGAAANLTSDCEEILAQQHVEDSVDYAILRVSPAPSTRLEMAADHPREGEQITIFGHPRRRPLEWSGSCTVADPSLAQRDATNFAHQCDTEPGSSGSTVLNDELMVVGIHGGSNDARTWNYATLVAETPIWEFKTGAPTDGGSIRFERGSPTVWGRLVPGQTVTVELDAEDPTCPGGTVVAHFHFDVGASVSLTATQPIVERLTLPRQASRLSILRESWNEEGCLALSEPFDFELER